jgi:hypothetical protein
MRFADWQVKSGHDDRLYVVPRPHDTSKVARASWSGRPPVERRKVKRGASLGLFGLLLAGLHMAVVAEATSIVAVRVGDKILIAADTKGLLSAPGFVRGSVQTCKIRQGRGCFFAVAGPLTGPSGNTLRVGEESCAKADSADGKALAMSLAVREPFVAAFKHAERNALENISHGIDVLFAGKRDGALVGLRFGHHIISSSESQSTGIVEIGQGEIVFPPFPWIRQFLEGEGKSWALDERLVRRIIGIDMANRPTEVGLPIAILEVTASGARWIQQTKLCPDIDQKLWLLDRSISP